MVLEEDVAPPVLVVEALIERALGEKLFLEPQRKGLAEAPKPPRGEREVGLDQPIELEQRLLVEGHVVDFGGLESGLAQAIADSVPRKRGVVLLTGEALFLSGCHNPAVAHQGRRGVVVEGGDSEDVHRGATKSATLPAEAW